VPEEISVALVGMGGYGEVYLKELLHRGKDHGLRFVAAVDPMPENSRQIDDVRKQGVPIFPSLAAFQKVAKADLTVLATPPQFHSEQVVSALEQGSHVLCEKPAAASPDQIRQMIEARDRAKKLVAIGYQWSFSPAIHRLKQDISKGALGRAKRLKTYAFWPRDEKYYNRNDWAGKQKDAQGRLVLDSPVNNACAHYLHNMFYILGDRIDRSAAPDSVVAELYRATNIENYDTAVIRCRTLGDVEILFIATHVTQIHSGPILNYEFENATIRQGGEDGDAFNAQMADGSTVSYGAPIESNSAEKLLDVCRSIRTGKPVACGLEAAASQTACMFAAQQSMPVITEFPKDLISVEGEIGARKTYVRGLEASLNQCFEEFCLPSELNFPWSRAGQTITIDKNS
jgi:predicted dehydrogenase